MPNEARHRVICDLNEEEYQAQRHLASRNPERHPPLLEIFNEHGMAFNEGHIGRIAADALAAAYGKETDDMAQHQLEEAALGWTLTQKLEFMLHAVPYWNPPERKESPYWDSTPEQARNFFEKHPEVLPILAPETIQDQAAHKARLALNDMEKMEEINFSSSEWSRSWNKLKSAIGEIAGLAD